MRTPREEYNFWKNKLNGKTREQVLEIINADDIAYIAYNEEYSNELDFGTTYFTLTYNVDTKQLQDDKEIECWIEGTRFYETLSSLEDIEKELGKGFKYNE